MLSGAAADARLGSGVAGLGDVTGDGRPDVAAGAPRDDVPNSNGGLIVVAGAP